MENLHRPNLVKIAPDSLDIATLIDGYSQGHFTIPEVMELALRRASTPAYKTAWINRASDQTVMELAIEYQATLEADADIFKKRPLFGIPFAVKDNIDVAGFPTTAACTEAISYPEQNSEVTAALLSAGAICFGKTNMDQLATGLVGTRSAYGVCVNPFNPEYISGGSSSGSAIVVATGMVSFALGTDTAGSGRVPAGFCNVVGLKPSRGLISTLGVVPACPSLDCISIFSLTVSDVTYALRSCAGYRENDPYSRAIPEKVLGTMAAMPSIPIATNVQKKSVWKNIRVAIPQSSQLEFFGDLLAQKAFANSISHLKQLDTEIVEVDISPLLESALLLYQGPWLAERYEAIARRINPESENLLAVIRKVLANGKTLSGVDVFKGLSQLAVYKRKSEQLFPNFDILFLPTTGTHYKISDIDSDPIQLNSNLGRYTNFVNLLDLCALALPANFREDKLPFGITLMAPAFNEALLLALGNEWQQSVNLSLGIGPWQLPNLQLTEVTPTLPLHNTKTGLSILVFGLHMRNEPLNHELTSLGAKFIREVKTANAYGMKLMIIEDKIKGEKKFPAIIRKVTSEINLSQTEVPTSKTTASLLGEIWEIPLDKVGIFMQGIKPPLGIGTIELEDQSLIQGFLAEPTACANALDISQFGGWRAFLKSQS